MKPIIAITMGDPGGIGPEIILKSLPQVQTRRAITFVIGALKVFQKTAERIHLPCQLHEVRALDRSLLRENAVNLLDIGNEARAVAKKCGIDIENVDSGWETGKVSPRNGVLAYTAVKIAAYQGACGLIQGVVTAPVNKTSIRYVDKDFVGHTEYLAKVAEVDRFAMMFVSQKLRVTLVTIHRPLREVAASLKEDDILSKIMLTREFLAKRLKIQDPKIAVAALNPHGKEFGKEEERIIEPAVRRARQKGISAAGPLPGDQVFFDAYEGRFDSVVAMYHDQGLAPFKMIAFHDGVNVTLGLPYLRTSPDHGTGFDIAFQGKANPKSFVNAFRLIEESLT